MPAIAAAGGPPLQRTCAGGGEGDCTECRARESLLQRSPAGGAPGEAPPIVHDVLRAPGTPLDHATRHLMERRLGSDLGNVRVHTDDRAAASARAVDALAYTVGSSIVFDRGRYAPERSDGRALLAHELVHTIQQGSRRSPSRQRPLTIDSPSSGAEREARRIAASPPPSPSGPAALSTGHVASTQRPAAGATSRRLMRQHVEHFSGRQVGNVAAPGNVREDVLDVIDRLGQMWSIPANPTVNAERAAVAALPAGASVPVATIPETIRALRWNEAGHLHEQVLRHALGIATATAAVGQGQPNARADVLAVITLLNSNWLLSNAAALNEATAVRAHASDAIPDGLISQTISGISRLKRDFAGGNYRVPDLMQGTHAVTGTQHGGVEQILNPGATVTTTTVGGVTTTTTTMPAMTGAGPGGQYQTRMVARLRALLQPMATALLARQATVVQGFPIASAASIAAAAQEVVEQHFAPYIQAASREVTDLYHPGSFNLSTVLGDQSTRALSARDVQLWTEYFMTSTDYGTQQINDAHRPNDAEFTRVRDLFISANDAMVRNAIHSWPAEAATGTVYLNPWRDPAPSTQRRTRWDIFTTLIHEMMHKIAHPNFSRVADAMEDRAGKILREGLAEVMRHDLWDGPGNLVGRIAQPSSAALRARVEGAPLPYLAAAVVYHPDYSEISEAWLIVAQVGIDNAKAAYFLGRMELLGIGGGTHVRGAASLAGRADWATADTGDADVYVVQPGDTLDSVRNRTNAPANGILDQAGAPVAAGTALVATTRLRVPGIRWVRGIPGDTLASIARQSGVPVPELAEANGLPPTTPGRTPVAAGQRTLIPIHHVV